MLAVAARTRSYPVLLPDLGARERRLRAPSRRRVRFSPLTRMLAAAVLVIVPAIVYVHQSTTAARTGYTILALHQQIDVLQAENARLIAAVTALRAPDRVEGIATKDLGMVKPRQQQMAALTLAAPAVAAPPASPSTLWQRLGALLLRREAAAAESR